MSEVNEAKTAAIPADETDDGPRAWERLECARVLADMVRAGWPKSQLDTLEALWWKCRMVRLANRARAGRGDS